VGSQELDLRPRLELLQSELACSKRY
jgi:hypothetical protein